MDLSNLSEFILYTEYPSFGDHLIAQGVPQLLYEKYSKKCLLSNKVHFHSKPEIKEFLWGRNPYVEGFTDRPHTIYLPGHDVPSHRWLPDFINEQLGFNCGVNYIPPVYYKPTKIDKYKDSVLLDISSRSHKDYISKAGNMSLGIIKERFIGKNIKIPVFADADDSINRFIPNIDHEKIIIKDLCHYCDVLCSFNNAIVLNSGSGLLASSIKKYYNNEMNIIFLNLKYPDDNQNYNIPNGEIVYL